MLSFEAIIVWPIALYFLFVYPDWSWMYFVDPRRLPWGVSVLVMLGYAATLVGGYLAGWALLRARKPKILYGVLGGVAFALLLFSILCRGRLGSSGTFDEYHAGTAPGVGEGKLVWALVVTGLGIGVAAGLVGFALWEQGRRSRS